MEITGISAREILDSRGSPTLEAEIEIDKVFKGVAWVPLEHLPVQKKRLN